MASPQGDNKEENFLQKRESMVARYERQSSNQKQSEANLKVSPSTIPKEIPMDSQVDQLGAHECSNITNSTEKISPLERARMSTQLTKTSFASITLDIPDSQASSLKNEIGRSEVMENIENPITDFSQKPTRTPRKTCNKSESSSEFQPGPSMASKSGKQMNNDSHNTQKCNSVMNSVERQSLTVNRTLSQTQSPTEIEGKSKKLASKSESKEKIEISSCKSHSPAQSVISSAHSTSSSSTELSKALSDASSFKNICKKSGRSSSGSDSAPSDGSSDESK